MKHGKPQAKDIRDEDALAAIIDCMDHPGIPALDFGHYVHPAVGPWHGPANIWDLEDRLGFPRKVVLAKMKALERRGLIDGCCCGCRGDFELTESGKALIGGVNCVADRLEKIMHLAKEFYPKE